MLLTIDPKRKLSVVFTKRNVSTTIVVGNMKIMVNIVSNGPRRQTHPTTLSKFELGFETCINGTL